MATIQTHILGFPRVGAQRELKFALEQHWRGELSADGLEQVGRTLRARHWALQRDSGLDYVTVGDFAFYDHVANHIQLLGCEPARFGFDRNDTQLERYFAMARGVEENDGACGHDHCHEEHGGVGVHALEMTKWFDTNYHYLVPEFTAETSFSVACDRLFQEVIEATELGHAVKAVLIGPLTFLWLGKEKAASFDRLCLLERLLPVYCEVLHRLNQLGVQWIQVDEPILGLDLPVAWRSAFERVYWQLNQTGAKLMLATYFSPLEENLGMACRLPVAALHVDAIRAPEELASVSDWLPEHKVLSVGIVDGRNIWRTDLDAAINKLKPVLARRGRGTLWLAPSCSLLHVPFTLDAESHLDPELKSWLAFAQEKLSELEVLKTALRPDASVDRNEFVDYLDACRNVLAQRRSSERGHRPELAARLAALPNHADRRKSPFAVRQVLQRARFKLPLFPTTTIGSFPQTADIRAARASLKGGQIDASTYEQKMKQEIAFAVKQQEALGIDVLVHGEAERNDMVEYFGEQLEGFAFTRFGWVQSYGARCVKPPIICGDVSRPRPMTVDWTVYAQSLTTKPMKGMLTGPITILQWSFVRDDQPRSETALQIALAIRDEVSDLEQAGIGMIQIDEPAIREGLPLRRAQWENYLAWATRAFCISASAVDDATQIHTHMCYSEFNDILDQIAAMDADVITIETSRSDMELLTGFGHFRYPNEIGPGVYDIHSPRVPTTDEMVRLLHKAAEVISPRQLWVNPDCGLKTRGWAETEIALSNMIEAAYRAREAYRSSNRATEQSR